MSDGNFHTCEKAALGWRKDGECSQCAREHSFAQMTDPKPSEPREFYWLIKYEDNDVPEEVFCGENAEKAAPKRYAAASVNWNCYLFVEEQYCASQLAAKDAELRSCQKSLEDVWERAEKAESELLRVSGERDRLKKELEFDHPTYRCAWQGKAEAAERQLAELRETPGERLLKAICEGKDNG